ncbi:IS1634 family transposase [Subsaximicrobium wynnwilliamsii]|uniref:IS1634 family transposase n=2 Tax=Subsaximicrobium wynnwilliamsii TaxID=291179 RepID=A0A5C6ZBY0_9FLAO|nr:IS1634 family transposase [Subsaximicrobium wynnwilliamsii]TXD86082.1 IS1634 family transposase [Subsaximicrobium wynnwilliamsii]TXD99446.1 IS1634 family transposase [Subsaximicrobium wynnwilliamsii]
MFVRKKQNKSGVISVQVVDKSTGRYRMLRTIGSSSIGSEVERLVGEAKQWIKKQTGSQELDFTDYAHHTKLVLQGIEQIAVHGPALLLGKIFDEVGFGQIKQDLFRQLVLARLCYPASKLKTTDYLSKYQFLDIDVQVVYRYLDKLYKEQKELVQQISYQHTLRILDNKINVVFYDVTTVYFEAESEDDLRRTGFSKDGKHQHPQIVLGLLVSKGGYPLAYDIFKGNQFEGHTMLPIINAFQAKYNLDKLVVVADAGLLSKENIQLLEQGGYGYILGARIKSVNNELKEKILALKLANAESQTIEIDPESKLIVSYSQVRARKDAHNRKRGLDKLEKHIKSGKLTKASINNRGYNKYLHIENEIKISIRPEKIEEDKKWDGLKGYITNTNLTKEDILENYKDLWQIEKAFRVAKSDLEIRPIYHRVQRRIEAHICIAFVAYKIYKELERQLKTKGSTLSPEKAIDIAKTIYAVKVKHPVTKEITYTTIINSEQQQNLAKLFDF